jgi:serine/threonine protein kinase
MVYKGELDDEIMVVVKRMAAEMVSDNRLNELKSEMEVLTKVRHKHLVALRGHCLDDNEKILVLTWLKALLARAHTHTHVCVCVCLSARACVLKIIFNSCLFWMLNQCHWGIG